MVSSSHARRVLNGFVSSRGACCRDCGRLLYASISVQTGVCGLCVGMTVLQPRDIADLTALGVLD